MASLKETTAAQFNATSAATASTHVIRKGEYDTALAGKSATGHTHTASQVTDLEAAVKLMLSGAVVDTDSVDVTYSGGEFSWDARLKTGGCLAADADGIYVAVGSGEGQAAAGTHSHAELHAALTVVDSDTVDLTLVGQQLTGAVRLKTGGALRSDADGVSVALGTSASTAAAGDHTHGQLHDPLTAVDTTSLDFTLSGQELRGVVIVKATGGLEVTAEGLAVVWGSGENQVPTGPHTHGLASSTAHGFLSASDKAKLDRYGELVNPDYPVLYTRADALLADDYLGGQYRWSQDMEVTGIALTSDAAGETTTLTLCVSGIETAVTVDIPTGSANAEVQALDAYTSVNIGANCLARWKCTTGPASASADAAAARIYLAMNVRPAIGTLPEKRINCGGSATGSWGVDEGYGGAGAVVTSASAISVLGVTNPAPEAVYQCQRTLWNTTYPLVYTVTGLAVGISYKVRLHFAELTFDNVGDCVFDIAVAGASTQSAAAYDILSAAGSKFKAAVREFTLQASSAGSIAVTLSPNQGLGGYYYSQLNGLEVIRA